MFETIGYNQEENNVPKECIPYQNEINFLRENIETQEKNKSNINLSNLVTLNIWWVDIETKSDRYQKVLLSYKKYKDICISNWIKIISLDDVISLYIKESWLNNNKISKSGAQWIWQLMKDAKTDIQNYYQRNNVKLPDSLSDYEKNFISSMVYFWITKNRVKNILTKELSNDELLKFTYAAYNLWVTKLKAVYNTLWQPKTRTEFADNYTKRYMNINSSKVVIDTTYNLAWYKDYFSWYNSTNNIVSNGITSNKSQEFIRYTEMIIAMNNSVVKNNKNNTIIIQKDKAESYYGAISKELKKLNTSWEIKSDNFSKKIKLILLDNWITLNWTEAFWEKQELVINKDLLKLVDNYHEIKPKETWYWLADKYKTTIEQIKALNPQVKTLNVWDLILIEKNKSQNTNKEENKTNSEVAWKTHKVKPKETLYSISKQYWVNIEELKKVNGLISNNINIWSKLIIPTD